MFSGGRERVHWKEQVKTGICRKQVDKFLNLVFWSNLGCACHVSKSFAQAKGFFSSCIWGKKKKYKILNKEKKKDPIIYFCRYIAMNQYFLISQQKHFLTWYFWGKKYNFRSVLLSWIMLGAQELVALLCFLPKVKASFD